MYSKIKALSKLSTYLFPLTLAYALLMLKPMIYAHYLGYQAYGEISKCFVYTMYLVMFSGLGTQFFLLKKLPMYYINNKVNEVNAAVQHTLLIYFIFLSVVTLALAVAKVTIIPDIKNIYFLVPLYALSQVFFNVSTINIRSQSQYTKFAWYYLLRSMLIVIAVFLYGVYIDIVYIALLMEAICNIAVSYKQIGSFLTRAWSACFDKVKKGSLLKQSVALLAVNGISLLYISSDKLIGALALNNKIYSGYAFVVILGSILQNIQFFINVVMYTELGKLVGKGDYQKAYAVVNRIFLFVVTIACIAFYPCLLVIKWTIMTFMVKYAHTVPLIKYIYVSGVMLLANFYSSLAVLMDKEAQLTRALMLFWLLAMLIFFAFLKASILGLSLLMLARLSVILQATFLAVSYFVALKGIKGVGVGTYEKASCQT